MNVKEISPIMTYQALKSNLEHTFLIDCRTRPEYEFVGHPPMAYNIPYEFWIPKGNKKNSHFVEDVMKRFKQTDTLLIICRSGQRSFKVCEELMRNGFEEVLNVEKGFEGDKVENDSSIYYGYRRHLNGWQHDGLPYTYELKEELVYKVEE